MSSPIEILPDAGEGFDRKRVIAVDLENEVLAVVSEADYAARRFDRFERVPFSEALWLPEE